jgi:hypothetical protein
MSSLLRRFVGARRAVSFNVALTALLWLAIAGPSQAATFTSFAPAGGPSGTQVQLRGTGLNATTAVRFNGLDASFSVQADSLVYAYVPSLASNGFIQIVTGANTTNSPSIFFVVQPPSLNNFSPNAGSVGTSVTINGSSFVSITSVKFNGVASSYSVNSTNQIVATVPPGASSGVVSVSNPAGTSVGGTFYFPPQITSFTPGGGTPGTSVTIIGNNFSITNQVDFNGVGVGFSIQNDNRILTSVPGGATTGVLHVTTAAGTTASLTPFYVGAPPSISDFTPTGGPSGTTVIIHGANFDNLTGVAFNGVSVPFHVLNSGSLSAVVPGNTSTGPISATNPAGTGTSIDNFYVGAPPTVRAFTPSNGPAGTAVTLKGTGFLNATRVRFGGVDATSFSSSVDSVLVATVPAAAVTGPINVTNPAGSGASATSFGVGPRLTSLTPPSVPASAATGSIITLTGDHLTGAYDVRFNGTLASFVVDLDTQITAFIPPGATTGPVTVTTPQGTATSPFAFEIVTFTPPAHAPFASWTTDVMSNLPVCAAVNDQSAPVICADSTGGAFIAWMDNRSGDWNVYLQHVTGFGAVAQGWPQDGLLICNAPGTQQNLSIIPDRVGGAIVAWEDSRNSSWDIYAIRIRADRTLAAGWLANGTPVCIANGDQSSISLAPDGIGGALITWQDYRSGYNYDVYAQRLTSNGQTASGWDLNGIWVSADNGSQYLPAIVSDGGGGAFVAFRDDPHGGILYLQHILGSGLIASGWPSNGRLFAAAAVYHAPSLFLDGSGSIYAAWTGGPPYIQRALPDGSFPNGWSTSPKMLNTGGGSGRTMAVSDAGGGIFAAWFSPGSGWVQGQHLNASGARFPGWPAEGLYLHSGSYGLYDLDMTADGQGGAMVTWRDQLTGEPDIYLQRMFPSAIAPGWPVNGAVVCAAAGGQYSPRLVASPTAGTILTWLDTRGPNGVDIYAQNLGLSGKPGNPEPHILSIKDIKADQGGKARISWQRSLLDTLPTLEVGTYGVWRRVTGTFAAAAMRKGATLYRAEDSAPTGTGIEGALRVQRTAAQDIWWEGLASIPGRGQLNYSYTASTLHDSTSAGPATEVYMVDAHASFGPYLWSADPDSGHSVDDTPPLAPRGLTATYAASQSKLHWLPTGDNDLAGYEVHRGTSADFTPSAASRIGTTVDTTYTDPQAAGSYYKVLAIDVHGNAGAIAVVVPPAFTGVGEGGITTLEWSAPSPNPASTSTQMRLRLPQASHVRVGVFDAAGRKVRTLVDAALVSGEHPVTWDLRDDRGRLVNGGLYFARLESLGRSLVQRMVVTH